MMTKMGRSLFIANPMWDETYKVHFEFLIQENVPKAKATLEFSLERMQELCKKAINPKEEIPARCGGGGANVMVPVAKLCNRRCSIIGMIGSDDNAQSIEAHLKDINVKSSLIKVEDKDCPTGRALCFITPDGERSMMVNLGAAAKTNAEIIHPEKFKKFDHLHIDGYSFCYPGIVPKCLDNIPKGSTLLSINLPTPNIIQLHKSQFQQYIPYFRYIFGDVEEILELTGASTIQEALASFDDDQVVAATNGPNACWVKASGEKTGVQYEVPTIKRISNKTGAGDRWAGMFLAAALEGKNIQTCTEMAIAAATNWIEQDPGTYTAEKMWKLFAGILNSKN